MSSVADHHAGVASGVNNAVSRAAGLLAIAALGVVLRSRFDSVLDAKLASLALPVDVLARVAAERGKLGGADVGELRDAISLAFVAGFRTTMLVAAALAALAAASAFALVGRERVAASPHV